MRARINGHTDILSGSGVDIILSLLDSSLDTAEGILHYLKNLSDCYDADIFIPDVSTISSNIDDYIQYAYILSLQLGHLILVEGDGAK